MQHVECKYVYLSLSLTVCEGYRYEIAAQTDSDFKLMTN